jgi:hypothetical protein
MLSVFLASTLIVIGTNYLVVIEERMNIEDKTGNNVWFYKNGSLIYETHNSQTQNGTTYILWNTFNSSYTKVSWNYLAIGTGTDDGNPTNNAALITELDRQAATYYRPVSAYSQWGLNYTFSFAAPHTITEAGVLSAASNGILAFYIGNMTLAVTSADTLKICWKGSLSGST